MVPQVQGLILEVQEMRLLGLLVFWRYFHHMEAFADVIPRLSAD